MVDQPANRPPPQTVPPRRGPPGKPRGGPGPLPFLLILLFIAYVSVFMILPQYTDIVPETLLDGFEPMYRLAVAGGLFFVIAVLIMMLSRKKAPSRGRAQGFSAPVGRSPQQGEVRKFKPVAPDVVSPGRATDGPVDTPPKVFIYPKEVEGGIYGETYISIDEKKVMKLRSLVVEPEYLT